jgi:hypothetical protein
MQDAVAKFELAEAAFKVHPDESETRHAYRAAEDEVLQVFLLQYGDPEFPVYEQEDYSHSSDLIDGREVNVFLDMKSSPPKKHRAEASAWLRSRGKKRLEHVRDQLLAALLNQEELPIAVYRAMLNVRIKVRRKTTDSWRG